MKIEMQIDSAFARCPSCYHIFVNLDTHDDTKVPSDLVKQNHCGSHCRTCKSCLCAKQHEPCDDQCQCPRPGCINTIEYQTLTTPEPIASMPEDTESLRDIDVTNELLHRDWSNIPIESHRKAKAGGASGVPLLVIDQRILLTEEPIHGIIPLSAVMHNIGALLEGVFELLRDNARLCRTLKEDSQKIFDARVKLIIHHTSPVYKYHYRMLLKRYHELVRDDSLLDSLVAEPGARIAQFSSLLSLLHYSAGVGSDYKKNAARIEVIGFLLSAYMHRLLPELTESVQVKLKALLNGTYLHCILNHHAQQLIDLKGIPFCYVFEEHLEREIHEAKVQTEYHTNHRPEVTLHISTLRSHYRHLLCHDGAYKDQLEVLSREHEWDSALFEDYSLHPLCWNKYNHTIETLEKKWSEEVKIWESDQPYEGERYGTFLFLADTNRHSNGRNKLCIC